MLKRVGSIATGGAASTSQSLQTLAGGAIVVAALYFARDVLIPLALALLLTFLLAPAVLRLRRWGLGRIPAVITTAVVAFTLIGLLGWIVTGQLLNLAHQLPGYQQNISQKLKSFDTPGEGLFERTARDVLGAQPRPLRRGGAGGNRWCGECRCRSRCRSRRRARSRPSKRSSARCWIRSPRPASSSFS